MMCFFTFYQILSFNIQTAGIAVINESFILYPIKTDHDLLKMHPKSLTKTFEVHFSFIQ